MSILKGSVFGISERRVHVFPPKAEPSKLIVYPMDISTFAGLECLGVLKLETRPTDVMIKPMVCDGER
jgi:hypothetical protein